ncbi:phosphoglycerate kinase [Abditibacterium utsteinense]|uniref:Phosphoglycerate kinase n=1 Tax=Abditibacterium utsteinense TaxID=1960156 RepID=A0A2S8SQP6_9BACT|nr:phosphoglycerate kinase [Abditibacterium utsteinense]PQV63105.1 phosphoglycerate kinase [Abditibacterium utsteinense]
MKKTIKDISVANQTVLVRVDYNVPLDDNGQITDDARIRETIPTLQLLLDGGAAIILMAHFGRPKGKVVDAMRLTPVSKKLQELLGRDIQTANDTVGLEATALAKNIGTGQVLLLENTRFEAGEEQNDPILSEKLASFGTVFVNDAFGAAHRAHASTEGVARVMHAQGKPCVAGLLMARELEFLGQLLHNPPRPFVAILGGVKVSDKIGVIRNLLPKVDTLLVGGAMAYAFEKARGREVGTSYFKSEDAPIAAEVLELVREKGYDFRTPLDFLVADRDAVDANVAYVDAGQIPSDKMSMDIGPKTIANYSATIENAKTVLWNGPMGRFEVEPFSKGTLEVARAVSRSTETGGLTIIGGGDSAAAVNQMGLGDQMSHVSTGGGASLEFLEGRELPGVAVLDDKF